MDKRLYPRRYEMALLRRQDADLEAVAAAHAVAPVPSGTARMLVQVVAQVAVPTATGKYFACHPVEAGGIEVEGGTVWLTPVADQTMLVGVVGSKVPVAGDRLIAHTVGGRWIAEHGAPGLRTDRTFRVKPMSCASLGSGAQFANLYLPGARVVFRQGGDVIGDLISDPAVGGGFVSVACDSTLPVDVTVSAWRYDDLSVTYPAGTATGTAQPVLHPAAGFGIDEAAVRYPLKTTLRLSDPFAAIDLVGAVHGTPESAFGCGLSWSGSYVRTVPVFAGGTGDVTFTWRLTQGSLTLSYRHNGGLVVRDGQVKPSMAAVADSDPFGATGGGTDYGLPQGDRMDVAIAVGLDASGAISLRYGGDPTPGTYLSGTVRIWEP